MYIPPSFAEHDTATLHAFMAAHPLAALVTNVAPVGLFATHLPLVLDAMAGEHGTLFGHVARANPHAKLVAGGPVDALVIFTGPDAYVRPSWYATKQETAKVVPTWNYVAVHATCTLHMHDDAEFLRTHLAKLTHQHESSRHEPWQMTDAPDEYIAQQLKAIVGVELRITKLEGKWKMSQNRGDADIDGVVRGLGASDDALDRAVAEIVRARRPVR
jgi:transcriptional regulator